MKISVVPVLLGLLFSLPACAQQCARLQLMEVDSTKVYAAGQKVRYEEAHGAYTGLLSADSLYFLCPGKITVTKRGSSAPGEAFENGSVYIYIRRATDRQWTKKVVGYKCEDLAFIPGKMEFAVFNGKELQVGSHNAVCILSEQK